MDDGRALTYLALEDEVEDEVEDGFVEYLEELDWMEPGEN